MLIHTPIEVKDLEFIKAVIRYAIDRGYPIKIDVSSGNVDFSKTIDVIDMEGGETYIIVKGSDHKILQISINDLRYSDFHESLLIRFSDFTYLYIS